MKCIGLTLILKAQGTDLRQREMPQVMQLTSEKSGDKWCLETWVYKHIMSQD